MYMDIKEQDSYTTVAKDLLYFTFLIFSFIFWL